MTLHLHGATVALLGQEGYAAISEGDPVTFLQSLDQLGHRYPDDFGVAARRQRLRAQHDLAAGEQGHPALRERGGADFRAGQVDQDANFRGSFADAAQPFYRLVDRPMGQRQTSDVHPRFLHGRQSGGLV